MLEQAVLETLDAPSLDSVNEEELVAEAYQELMRFDEQTMAKRDMNLEGWQLYLENRPDHLQYASPDDAQDSSSNIQHPVIAEAVDAIHAQLMQSLFPTGVNFFRGLPVSDIATEFQDLVEAKVRRDLEKLRFLDKAGRDIKNEELDGFSAVACPFVRKSKTVVEYEHPKFFGIPLPFKKPREVKKEVVDLEATDFAPLAANDWWIDGTVDEFEDTSFTYRYWMKPYQLKKIKAYKNTDDLKPYSEFQGTTSADSRKWLEYTYSGINVYSSINEQNYPKGHPMACSHVCVYERWGDFYINETLYENHVLVWSNDCTFHYFGPNPYNHGRKPFLVVPYIQVPNTLLGKSAVQDIIPLAHSLNTFTNQAIDLGSFISNAAYTYDPDDEVLADYLSEGLASIRPGSLIPRSRPDSLSPLEIDGTIFQYIVQYMSNIKEEIRESTGGVSYATGGLGNQDPNRTATEANILSSGTSTRFQNLIQFQEKNKYQPYLEMAHENYRQFMSQPVKVPKFKDILTPNLMKRILMDYDVTGSRSVMEKTQKIQKYQSLFPLLAELKAQGLVIFKQEIMEVDAAELVKDYVRSLDISREDELFVVISPEEANPDTGNDALDAMGDQNEVQGVPGLIPGQAAGSMGPPLQQPGLFAA